MSLLLFGLLNLAGVPACKEDPLCTCDSDVRRCRCVGRQLDRVPQHLGSSVTHLIIDDSTLTAVRALDFENYPQLVDIAIRNAGRLQSVQASAFEPLKRLKRLSINGCSSLRRVNGSFVLCNGRGCILTLNLANNGLEEVPGLTRAVTSGPIFRGATYIVDSFEGLFRNFHDKLADLERRYEVLSSQTDSNESSLKTDLSSLEEVHAAHDRLKSDLHSLQKLFSVVLKELSLFRRSLNSVKSTLFQHESALRQDERRSALAPNKCGCPADCSSLGEFDWKEVDTRIAASLNRYDSDKTGMPDYALESAGGTILSVRCSETYDPRSRVLTLFGIPVLYKTYSPRKVIQPGTMPGECWAFKGSVGGVVIQLGGTIKITGVSYEHVPRSISPDGHIESAPKDFEVYGLMSKNDPNATLLGSYTYKDGGDALQYFPVQAPNANAVPIVELKVLRNHGHPRYTCLYRFRVHGYRVKPAYGYEDGS